MNGLVQRWNALSRAAKWVVLAAIGMVLYFVVVEPVSKWANDRGGEASITAQTLKELREQAQGRSQATTELRASARVFVEVLPPGDLNERVQSVSSRIDEILRTNKAGDVDFSTRSPASLGSRTLPNYVDDPATQELQRVAFDISFTGTPERAIEIVRQLEKVPEITLISDIRLKRIDARGARLVQVDLNPEVWGVARKGSN